MAEGREVKREGGRGEGGRENNHPRYTTCGSTHMKGHCCTLRSSQ